MQKLNSRVNIVDILISVYQIMPIIQKIHQLCAFPYKNAKSEENVAFLHKILNYQIL